MRTPADALRSLNRYVALALGSDWEVRLSTEKGTFARPYARVIQVPSIEMIAQSWAVTSFQAAYQVVAFPIEGASADESQLNALAVVDALWLAFAGPGIEQIGHNHRVPLYDYSQVPLAGPEAFATESNRRPNDYMWVEGVPDVAPYQDPDDERLWSVAMNIRMSWTRSAVVPSPGSTAVGIGAAPQVEGQ